MCGAISLTFNTYWWQPNAPKNCCRAPKTASDMRDFSISEFVYAGRRRYTSSCWMNESTSQLTGAGRPLQAQSKGRSANSRKHRELQRSNMATWHRPSTNQSPYNLVIKAINSSSESCQFSARCETTKGLGGPTSQCLVHAAKP